MSWIVDFSKKEVRKAEDQDVPAALADLIHQQRTQEPVDDMYASFCVWDISFLADNHTSPVRPSFIGRFAHPYQYELDHLTVPDELLSKPDPQVGPGKLTFILLIM